MKGCWLNMRITWGVLKYTDAQESPRYLNLMYFSGENGRGIGVLFCFLKNIPPSDSNGIQS